MKTLGSVAGGGISFLAAAILGVAVAAGADGTPPDWWQAQGELAAALARPDASLAATVKTCTTTPPADARTAMRNLNVFMRAGMTREAAQALRDLKRLCPDLRHDQVASIYYDACDRREDWETALACVDVFADNVKELTLENRLLRQLLDNGWTVERIEAWFAEKPRGVNGFWMKERLRFNMEHGRGAALIRELADRVRANPRNADEAVFFLDAILYARGKTPAPDTAWLADLVKPEKATGARDMAERLARLEAWPAAAHFYRQATAIPLTDDEVHRLGMMCQVMMEGDTIRGGFAAQTREGLADCLLKLGKPEEAQKWMVEAADIREKNHLGRNAMFAGAVQAASGQRVIEGRIREQEKTAAADTPEYWQERAHYYRGRAEPAQEEEALLKGLALAPPMREDEQPRTKGGPADRRGWLLADYALFLQRQQREDEAVALLRREMAEAPAGALSATRAAHLLAFEFEKRLRVDDDVPWTWLASRPKWDYTEERLLWRLLENAPREQLEQPFARAEKLAAGADPTRAYTLGWIENRMHFPQRSLPLLEDAVRRAPDAEFKGKAGFALFESCLDTGDWRRAEANFPDAAARLTANEAPDWLAKIAVLAARAGAKADAMRLWRRVANIDLTATRTLPDLAKAGLRDDLAAFYREMQAALPASRIPPQALAALQGMPLTGSRRH